MNNIEGVKEAIVLNLVTPHPDLPPQRGAGELSARLFLQREQGVPNQIFSTRMT